MSSQFNSFLAAAHRDDLQRRAERSRAAERTERGESLFPNFIRTRRLGRLFRIVPPAGHRPA